MIQRQHTVAHFFCGSGGGGLGFRRAGFRSLLAIDNNEAACRDYRKVVGTEAACADLEKIGPEDIRRLCPESPDVLFTSAPCKGMSGCLPEARALTDHYLRLNELSFRGVWLALEAWERVPRLILFENVPRITSRGRPILERIVKLLQRYGYAVDLRSHCCGEIGGLGQRRKRFLILARQLDSVPAFVRLPPTKRVRAMGEVLGELPVPLPGGSAGGPMHRLPRQSAMNWLRLALIPAGKDWHALEDVDHVRLTERASRHNGPYGVEIWGEPAHAVLGYTRVHDHWGAVADPRLNHPEHRGCRGVQDWSEPSKTIRGAHNCNNAPASVADPRISCSPRRGAMGVEDWATPSHAIIGHLDVHSGWGAVADPRCPELVGPPLDLQSRSSIHLVIRATDGTWHRPMTTLELAALQGFPTRIDGQWLEFDGSSHAAWRERIGNAVPPPAAEAIARTCAATLDAAADGTWSLDSNPIWVRRPHTAHALI